ncbi:MAG: hypothetical protein EOO28_18705 [Comamonadaceae bacterium]|nr:MAG: hypothetical protein EOO28_18705 [Comamonadaceae bacterium]
MKTLTSLIARNTLRAATLAAIAVAAFAGASSAQARDNVQLSINVGNPGYVQPAPVYVQPRPVYVQPRPVYVQPRPVYVQPAPVYVQRNGAWGDRDRDGVPNIYDRNDRRHPHHGHRDWSRGPNGDADRDGVPNRFDRFPSNPNYR